jgi:hypothetical protein
MLSRTFPQMLTLLADVVRRPSSSGRRVSAPAAWGSSAQQE